MSDSHSDPPGHVSLPPSAKIERCLRAVVARIFHAGNPQELTVKRVRTAAEEELELSKDFLKTEAKWKDKSKEIISDEVKKLEASVDDASIPAESPEKPKPKPTKAPKANGASTVKRGTKRASHESAPPPKKRQKQRPVVEEDDESALSSEKEDDVPQKDLPAKGSDSPAVKQDSPAVEKAPAKAKQEDAHSDSDLSSVIDEPVPQKRRQKSDATRTTKSSKATKPKTARPAKAKPDAALSPQKEEIKRLQGWLVKCGIRKLWFRELQPFDTDKAKIKHLKGMLSEAGMDGRYSEQKAREIKEQRELAADLEAVQAGNRMWGESDKEEEQEQEQEGGRPRRRLAKGLRELEVFMDDEDGSD